MKDHNKITFAQEYCRCRRIKFKVTHEALLISKEGKMIQLCYSLYNLTYSDIVKIIDDACSEHYDVVTTYYTNN